MVYNCCSILHPSVRCTLLALFLARSRVASLLPELPSWAIWLAGAIAVTVSFLASFAEFTGYNLRDLLKSRSQVQRSSSADARKHEIRQAKGVVIAGEHVSFQGELIIGDVHHHYPTPIMQGQAPANPISNPISSPSELLVKRRWFFGRRQEIQLIESELNLVHDGTSCVCIYGFAGVGKSALLRQAVSLARERGMKVIGDGQPVSSLAVGSFEGVAEFASRLLASKLPFLHPGVIMRFWVTSSPPVLSQLSLSSMNSARTIENSRETLSG